MKEKGQNILEEEGRLSFLYSKEFDNKSDALKAEYEFKHLPRRKKEEFLIKEAGGDLCGSKRAFIMTGIAEFYI